MRTTTGPTLLMLLIAVTSTIVIFQGAAADEQSLYYYDCRFANGCNDLGECVENTDGATNDLKKYVCECRDEEPAADQYDCYQSAPNPQCYNCVAENTINDDDCEDAGLPTRCRCKETHFGDECEFSRVSHTCGNQIDIYIRPHGPFEGLVQVIDPTGNVDWPPNCVSLTRGPPNNFYHIEIAYSENDRSCLNPIRHADFGGPVTAYEVRVLVQIVPEFRSDADRLVIFKCEVMPTGETMTLTPQISYLQVDGVASEQPYVELVVRGANGVELRILDADGNALTSSSALAVGTEIKLSAVMVINEFHEDFSIQSLTISNYDLTLGGSAMPGQVSMGIVNNWCVAETGRSVVRGLLKDLDETGTDSPVVRTIITMGMMYIPPVEDGADPVVYFSVVICMGTCTPSTDACDSNTDARDVGDHADFLDNPNWRNGPTARRRRSVYGPSFIHRSRRDEASDDARDVIETMTLSVNVIDPRQRTASHGRSDLTICADPSNQSTTCFSCLSFIVPISMMGVLLLASVAMTFYFSRKATSVQHKQGRGGIGN